jgi:CBS domain-containing protein
MDSQRIRSEDIQPIKVRLRQVFFGSGESVLVENVYCPARERSVTTEACKACEHNQGAYKGPDHETVFCDHHQARELTLRQALHARAVQPDPTPVAEVMTTHVLCVRPDVSIEALSSLLVERNISGVPVVDARGVPIGIVSKTDLVRHRHEDGDTGALDAKLEPGLHTSTLVEATVADLMTPVPIAFSEDTPISQVAAAMAYERIHRLPILGQDGTVVGIVSSLDIVGWYAQREGYVPGGVRRGV